MSMAGEQFERDFRRTQRRVAREPKVRIARFLLAVVVFGMAMGAAGFGWGYSHRLGEECAAREGVFDVFRQTCDGDRILPAEGKPPSGVSPS